jgi:hypothetical protein
MAKKLISASSLFKGKPEEVFSEFIKGAKDATTSVQDLLAVNQLLQGKLKEVGEAGQTFAKNFDKKRAKDIESLDKQVEELVKSQDNLNDTIKQQEKLIKKLEAALKKKKQEDTAEAKLAKEKVRLQKQINTQTSEQAKENAKLRKTIQQNRKATRELVDIEQELGREYNDLKEVIEDLDKVEFRRVSTAKEAQEQNKALRIIVRNLNKEIPEQAEQIERLNAVIDQNSELQKENADALTAQKINIGNYKESVTEALQETGLFGDELSQLNSIISTALDLFGPLSSEVADYADNTDQATVSTKGFGKAFKGLNNVVKASVIGLVVTAVVSIGAAFSSGRAGAIRFEKALASVQNSVKAFIGVLSNAGTGFLNFFGGIFDFYVSAYATLGSVVAKALAPALQLVVNTLNATSALTGVTQAQIAAVQQAQAAVQSFANSTTNRADDVVKSWGRITDGALQIGEAFKELPEALEAGAEASAREIEFIERRFDIADDIAAVRIEIAKLNGEIAKFDQQAGDTTRTLNERIQASENAIALEKELIKETKRLATLELEQAKNGILVDLERNKALTSRQAQFEALIQLGEDAKNAEDNVKFFEEYVKLQREIDELGENSQLVEEYEEFTSKIEGLLNTVNEAEVALQQKRQERLENQRDLFEQNLDFIIDIGEANAALLEQQVNDTRISTEERLKLFKQLTDGYADTVQQEQDEFNRLIEEQEKIFGKNLPKLEFQYDESGLKLLVGGTEVATDNLRELNKTIQERTSLDENEAKRLLEVIKNAQNATKEFKTLDRELKEVVQTVEELGEETIIDEQQKKDIEQFNKDFKAFLATIPKDLSTLTSTELQNILNQQEAFNERREALEEDFEKKKIEQQLEANRERQKLLEDEFGEDVKQSEDYLELKKEEADLELQLTKALEDDKTKTVDEALKKRLELEKKNAEDLRDIQEQIFEGLDEGIVERTRRRVEQIDNDIDSLENRITQLQETAQIGNEIQEKNLVSLRKQKAELEREKLETEERLQRIQAAIAIFESYTANLQNDPNTALTKTIVEANVLKELIKGFFFDGTENTGPGGAVDNKGGFLSVLHPYERVVPRSLNNVMKKDNGAYMSNEELAHAAQAWNSGMFSTAMIDPSSMMSSSWESNEAILEKFSTLEKAVKELPAQMPVPRYDYKQLEGIITETVKRGNRVERTSSSIRSRLHKYG